MELKETVEMMLSEDYKERFKAEYNQLSIRLQGLSKMLKSYKEGTLNFTPKCSYDVLKEQEQAMVAYAKCLENRAKIEDINLHKKIQAHAFQYDGDFVDSHGVYYIPDWAVNAYEMGKLYFKDYNGVPDILFIKSRYYNIPVNVGDYIIRGINGILYSCSSDIFEKYYKI